MDYTFKLLLVNAFVFAFELFFYDPMISLFALTSAKVLSMPWVIFTSMFMHADFSHIFYNMFALVVFGFILERIIGPAKFILVYFISGLIAGVASIIVYPNSISLGASGAIMGIVGMLTVLRPKMMVYWGNAPLPMIFLGIMYITVDVAGLFAPSTIGHAAHLGGFFTGAIFGLLWRKRFSEASEAKKKAKDALMLTDEELTAWEKEYM